MSQADNTLNVSSTSSDWKGVALSNFQLSPFSLDGILFASIEGFIQGIKFPEGDARREQAFVSSGWEAKNLAGEADRSGAYWQGRKFVYGSSEHHRLIERAIRARIAQNSGLAQVLASTGDATLVHITNEPESPTTSLPAVVFCRILNQMRDELHTDGKVSTD